MSGDSKDLLACPFCGGEADYYPSNEAVLSVSWIVHIVHCKTCQVRVQTAVGEKTARDMWNNRRSAPQSGMRAEGEALQLLLREHWLTGMLCDHINKTDVATCFCGYWQSAPMKSVGEAVNAWIEHVLTDCHECRGTGVKTHPEGGPQFECSDCGGSGKSSALPAASPAAPSSPRSAGPTGIGAAKIVAEYIRLRSTLDEDDAANIIHILHEAGVRFRLPSSDAAEGAGETDALARENHWRKLEGRDPSPLKPAPDAMREACAKIADSYTAPNRFKVSDQWKDDMSPAQVYETAAIDVSIAISKEIRDISAPVPPPDGASKEKPAYLKCPKCGEVWCLKHGALAPSDDVRSALADALESAAQCVASSHAMPGAYAKGVLGKIEKAQAALRSAPVSGPDLNRAALAEIIHKARFSADRVATSFAEEHGLGREYCFRIADSVLAFIGSSAPVTREAMILAGAKALFKRDVEEDVIDGEWDDNAAVHERIIADSAACLEAALALHSPVPEATVSGPAAWQALPYARPQELVAAFKSGRKFVLHYHGKTSDVTHMEAREHIVYVQPPGLPVKVWSDGSSAEGEGGGIWLAAATVSARDAVIEAARQEVVLAIAFLTRDGNTDRITETVRQLIPKLATADEKLRSLTQGAKP